MKFSSLLFCLTIGGQLLAQEYWQQEVNYTIHVELDDVNHLLRGHETFEYINNSPDVLDKIYIHIWPNAYKNEKTALAKQLYNEGSLILTKNAKTERGWIDSLDFKVNNVSVNWEYDPEHIDIAVLYLSEKLNPGQRIVVTTPFLVKIPTGTISRLGHIDQSYQITQWYPKPAVYDKNGWNQMPYLNQGEFYSEYGSFDVTITLPENYVVGATGDLQTSSEIMFLDSISNYTQTNIQKIAAMDKAKQKIVPRVSSKIKKTIRYTQTNVHDFAWFADKYYYVLKGEVELPHSKRKVTSWAMFTPQNAKFWKKAIEYINDGVYYYSLWNGDYPYNQVTAVDGTISAGGGMEYPNVTVIGNAYSDSELEVVIVHEVGHNWFYGILGSNERVHGWMDEGLNTANEVRYMQSKYPDNTSLSDAVLGGAFHFNDLDHHDQGDLSVRALIGQGLDQPIETHSACFTSINYGIIMYQKTGLVLNYLHEYLGPKYDECMQQYFETWKFKHPQPEDLKNTFETCTGKDLSWVFNDLIQTSKTVDFKLRVKKVGSNHYRATIKNVGQIDGPAFVQSLDSEGKIIEYQIVEPGNKKTVTEFIAEIDINQIVIDQNKSIPESNRQNNSWKKTGLFHHFEKPKFEFLIGDNESKKSNVFWTPIVAGNYYDKFMIGAAFHNYGIPFNKFQYLIAPMYSFGRNSISGISEFSYSTLPKKGLKISTIGVSVKSFKNDSTFTRNSSYYVIASPYWTADIGSKSKNNSPFAQKIRIQGMYRLDVVGPSQMKHAGGFAKYDWNYNTQDHKLNIESRIDFATNTSNSNQFGRASISTEYAFRYVKKTKSWISLRGYFGGFWDNHFSGTSVNNYSLALNGMNGSQDIFVEDYYFGRGLATGIWSQQRADNMGGFKSNSIFGATDQWLATANFYIQLPIPANLIGIFGDLGTVRLGSTNYLAYDAGLALKLGKVLAVYFPVYWNDVIENSFLTKKYSERIRFSLKLNLYNGNFKLRQLI